MHRGLESLIDETKCGRDTSWSGTTIITITADHAMKAFNWGGCWYSERVMGSTGGAAVAATTLINVIAEETPYSMILPINIRIDVSIYFLSIASTCACLRAAEAVFTKCSTIYPAPPRATPPWRFRCTVCCSVHLLNKILKLLPQPAVQCGSY